MPSPAEVRPDFLRLDGRRILVTGASGGIGRALAIEASRYGAVLVLTGRDSAALAQTARSLHGTGHEVLVANLGDLDQIPAVVRRSADLLGGLDALVHAAGIHSARPVKTLDADHVNAVLRTNAASALMLAKGFRDRRIPKHSPSIVLVSSVVATVGEAGVSAYAASKGAISSLTRALAAELAREGIRVNCIEPGIVTTAMTAGIRSTVGDSAFASIEAAHPLGLGTPDDVANAILYLVSEASSWVTGTALVVDGGYTTR
jgi:NAD(P)-dependent dehydrogenase (short-subunit alcohol dehydrogenase family)